MKGEESRAELYKAYSDLSEKHKKAFVSIVYRQDRDFFDAWVEHSRLPRSADTKKVRGRVSPYGEALDASLFQVAGGALARDIIHNLLADEGLLKAYRLGTCGTDDRAAAEKEVDAFVESLGEGSPFARLLGAYVKCYDDLFAMPVCDRSFREMLESLYACMQSCACRFEDWAHDMRVAREIDPEEVEDAARLAAERSQQMRKILEMLSEKLSLPAPAWETAEELLAKIDEVATAIEGVEEALGVKEFLVQLAAALRRLHVRHSSRFLQQRLANLQESAARELEDSAAQETPEWIDAGPGDSDGWLRWILGLDEEAVAGVLDELAGRGYPATAELVSEGNLSWIDGSPPTSTTGAKQPRETAAAKDEPPPASLGRPGAGVKSSTSPAGMAGNLAVASPGTAPGARAHRKDDAQSPSEQDVKTHGGPLPGSGLSTSARDKDAPAKLAGAHSQAAIPVPLAPAPGHDSRDDLQQDPIEEVHWGNESPLEIARAILVHEAPAHRRLRGEELRFKLAASGHRSLAYHLGALLEREHGKSTEFVPSWVFEALALVPHASVENVSVYERLQRKFTTLHYRSIESGELFHEHDAARNRTYRLLLCACSMYPSLATPGTFACPILESLHLGAFPSLHGLVKSLVTFSQLNITPGPELINSALTLAEWDSRRDEIIENRDDFRRRAANFTVSFMPATAVWREWLKPRGFIQQVLENIGSEATAHVQELRETIQHADIGRLIEDTRKKVLKKTNRLVGVAKRQLVRHAEEALKIAWAWLALIEAKPGSTSSHGRTEFNKLRDGFEQYADNALLELEALRPAGGMLASPHACAAILLADEIRRTRDLVAGKVGGNNVPTSSTMLLARDLLLFPALDLDESHGLGLPCAGQGEPAVDATSSTAAGLIEAILRGIGEGLPSLEDAFRLQCKKGNHVATRAIIELLAEEGSPEVLLDKLDAERAENISWWADETRSKLNLAHRELGDALAKGLVTPTQHTEHSNRLEFHTRSLREGKAEMEGLFHRYMGEVEKIRELIEKGRQEGLSKAEHRLATLSNQDPGAEARVKKVLQRGDVYLANDYIDRLESGGYLPPEAEEEDATSFAAFFGIGVKPASDQSAARKLYERLATTPGDITSLLRELQQENEICGIDISHASKDQRIEAAAALRGWFDFRPGKRLEPGQVQSIFEWIGFRPGKINWDPRAASRFDVETVGTVPCPVPQYGSDARQRYQAYVQLKRVTPDELVGKVERAGADSEAIILLYFNALDKRERRQFAHLCRSQNKTILLIDSVLMVYLAMAEGVRIRNLFECSLPFTYLMPYTVTASLLPPEMFFGRRREVEALSSSGPNGSCFLYGGRQIGKTVLLRHVERRFNDPAQGHVAKYIDLKLKGVGYQRDLDELWRVILDGLCSVDGNLVGKQVPKQVTPEWLKQRIEAWLREDSHRRILLLLDEADSFLEADGSKEKDPFYRCRILKGMMEDTGRRFKVVFAGLHNVQRSTRVGNNPLAHFGTPICIGPLLYNGEAREAYELVRRPLSCLGIFFDSPDLANSILARTNYYPNLIHIYCKNLLHHITDLKGYRDPGRTPPYIVRASDVDEAYDRQELRNELRDKFRLTLDLDRRFSLIANLLALYESDCPGGMSIQQVRDEVLDWWPQGFRQGAESPKPITFDGLRTLLEEMVGLGILRTGNDGLFSLRSPNVAALLGTQDEVASVIESSKDWEPPVEYVAQSFRSLVDEGDRWKRSPLTAAQESEIRDGSGKVVIVVGLPVAGLSHVGQALRHALGEDYVVALGEGGVDAFEEAMGKLAKRESAGKTVVLVGEHAPWDVDWVIMAGTRTRRFSKADAQVGVVFLCDPAKLWNLRGHWEQVLSASSGIIPLHPWRDEALRQALEDSPLGPQDAELRAEIRDRLGPWSGLLADFFKRVVGGKGIKEALGEVGRLEASGLDVAFGLDLEPQCSVLGMIARVGAVADAEELSMLFEIEGQTMQQETVRQVLWWAEFLDLLSKDGTGLRLDPVAERILGRASF